MPKILLPTDFSENSRNAIAYALNFYENQQTTFYLLNSYSPQAYRPKYVLESAGQIGLAEKYRLESLAKLQKIKKEFQQTYRNTMHKFIVHATSKALKEEVSKVVVSEGIDVIVMGTQGATGVKAIFLGTRTTGILKIATCPVLVIPHGCTFRILMNIAFVTNFKRNFSADILWQLRFAASLYRSSLRIMHINERERLSKIQESNRNTLEAYLCDLGVTWHWMPNFSTKTESIKLFIEELQIDFLTMVRYENSFFENLLREPVIKKVSFSVGVPFLVIPFDD